MYNLYIIKEETGNYEIGDVVVGRKSENFEGYILTSKDDLLKEEYLQKVNLGSDNVCLGE